MQLPESKIEKAAPTNDVRYYLNGIYHDKDQNVVVATNGSILARIPAVDNDDDHTGIIPLDAVKDARKQSKHEPKITINGAANTINGASYPLIDGKYPDYLRVIPDIEPGQPATITLNAKLLHELAQAISNNPKNMEVSIWITDKNSAMQVKSTNSPENLGVIMPCRDQ